MSNKLDVQKINVARYLDTLSRLPDVDPKDVAEARQVLKEVLKSNLDEFVTFHRGPNRKDGKVEVIQVYKASGLPDLQATVTFEQTGNVYCYNRAAFDEISPVIAGYLFAGLFDGDELTSLSQVPVKDQFDPKVQISFDAREVLLKKGSGIRDLYRCVLRKGDAKACENSEGLQKYAEAQQLAQRLETKRNDNIKKYVAEKEKETSALWKSAQEMVDAAEGFFGAGDSDEIIKIMNGYVAFRTQKVGTLDWEQAYIRSERTKQMMKKIGESAGGWPQFKNRFCEEPVRTRVTDCPPNREGGLYQAIFSNCDFGVTKTESYDNCLGVKASVGVIGNRY